MKKSYHSMVVPTALAIATRRASLARLVWSTVIGVENCSVALAISGSPDVAASVAGEDGDSDSAILIDPSAIHAGSIERRRDVALCIHRDDATGVLLLLRELRHDDVGCGRGNRCVRVLDACADVVG